MYETASSTILSGETAVPKRRLNSCSASGYAWVMHLKHLTIFACNLSLDSTSWSWMFSFIVSLSFTFRLQRTFRNPRLRVLFRMLPSRICTTKFRKYVNNGTQYHLYLSLSAISEGHAWPPMVALAISLALLMPRNSRVECRTIWREANHQHAAGWQSRIQIYLYHSFEGSFTTKSKYAGWGRRRRVPFLC